MTSKAKIDRLGTIQASIAKLQEEETKLKAYMVLNVKVGTRAEGKLFGISHSETERKTVAYKTIAERLGVTRQMIKANTKSSPVHTIKVTARQT